MKRTSSKSTKLKCGCDAKDTESFCPVCCPEEYECLQWPHIQRHIEKEMRVARYWATYHARQNIAWMIADWREQETMEDEVATGERIYELVCSLVRKEKEQAEALGGDCG